MKQTMHDKLLRLLKQRYVTPLDALKHAGCLSLAQRVSEWRRAGMDIDSKWVQRDGKRFMSYRLNA